MSAKSKKDSVKTMIPVRKRVLTRFKLQCVRLGLTMTDACTDAIEIHTGRLSVLAGDGFYTKVEK